MKKKEKDSVEDNLQNTRRRLKAKEEEYYTSEVGDPQYCCQLCRRIAVLLVVANFCAECSAEIAATF